MDIHYAFDTLLLYADPDWVSVSCYLSVITYIYTRTQTGCPG